MKLTQSLTRFGSCLDRPLDDSGAVTSLADTRFWASLVLIVLSACSFAHDPLFFSEKVGFEYGCGVLSLMLSFVVLSALFWDILLFGKPNGANLLLQVVMIAPFSLFMSRAFVKMPAKEDPNTLWSAVWKGVQTIDKDYLGFSNAVHGFMPAWATDVFSHWSVALVLLFVVVALCFKRNDCRIGLLFTAMLTGVVGVVAEGVSWQFVTGLLLLIGALALMYNPCEERCFYAAWIGEFGQEKVGELELGLISVIMEETYRRGRLSEAEYRMLVESRLQRTRSANADIRQIEARLRAFLLNERRFVRLTADSSGQYMTIDPRLLEYRTLWTALAIWPRNVVVVFLGVIWLISPLDLIPDALPFIGSLDDALVAVLTMKCATTTRRIQ